MERTLLIVVRKALHLAVAPLGLLAGPALHAAVTVTFTVTPEAVTNTYNGVITLQVKGLTNTETVVVQKFLDLDGAGVIDASAGLVQQFELTDGQAGMVIGGIVNSNVPGDTDATAGQITARLNFQSGDFIQEFGGKYLYKLSSPSGRFTPITNLFTVTSFPYAQKFSGKVVIEGTSTTVPNAIVLVENGNGSAVGGAVADSSGGYSVPAPPGAYLLAAFKSGYLFQSSKTGPTLALSSGETVTTNLTVASGTAGISGKLVDANNSNLGLPGILLSAKASNGLTGVGFTDTNGSFTLGVQSSPSQWEVKVDDTSLIVHGYLGLQNKTSVNAGQSGVTLAAPKATALFYGSVKDDLGNPLPGIDVYVNDNNDNLYDSDGYTDANGNYAAAALGGLNNDPWQVEPTSDTGPANYLFTQPAFDQNGGTNLSDGQTVLANFTALLATQQITGYLKDSGGNPIAGVGVYAYATINGVQFSQYVDTDGNGNYSLSVANGDWTVTVNCNGGSDSLDNFLGSGNYQCPNNQNVTINNNNGTADFTVSQSQGGSGQIDGYVKDASGNPVAGVTVNANGNGQNYASSTDGSGYYSFNNVGNGNWEVSVDCGGLNSLGYQCVSGQNVNVSGGSVEQDFTVQSSTLQVTIGSVLPAGTNGVFYSQTLQASGGEPPYSWSIPPYSAGLPPGLTLATDGVLSGTPATNGTFYFYVRVTDAAMNTNDSGLLQQTIASPQTLQITNVTLPSGTVGVPYSAQLEGTGGQPPISWSLATGSANPPPGLSLNSSGLISGTPTANGTFSFLVYAYDNNRSTTNITVTITINSEPVLSAPSWAANQFRMRLAGAAGQNYTVQMSTSLSSPNWTSLFVTNSAAANSFIVTDPSATDKQRFYRVQVGP